MSRVVRNYSFMNGEGLLCSSKLSIPETINFAEQEENMLKLWTAHYVYNECMDISTKEEWPKYSFYDGPPFATGLPHYGHILAGTIKDIVTRYAYQSGYHVERRFGWDCHGLPVENEIDKKLGIKGPDDVAKMGIKAYNEECRKIVMKYSKEWQEIVGRMGRWIDFENDYKTMYPWYMESIWWVFKQLYHKGLIYEGIKVMPYSTACNTPLSNFEAGQNYKDIMDPSVVVVFPLLDEPGVSLLAWTTTPWTLPSNLALCVNPTFEYVKVKNEKTGDIYIILEAQLQILKGPYTIIDRIKGTDLKGKAYEPLFPYFLHHKEKGAFRVLNDTYVTAETGTGIVHQAPYFGEDDFRCCLEAGIICKDQEIVCPVDSCGCFTQPVHDFLGKYVKDADKEIIKYLQLKKKLIVNSTIKHSYPFCWRTDTPLIYKAVPSWFLKVEAIKDKLLVANSETYWVPDFVKEKRFGNWLRDARDWAISRNRYWGNPIPLWISEDREEIVCVGSMEELERLTGATVEDIHRENIDHLIIPSKRAGQPPLRRIPEVFDCWFESGSMPYAQVHFPFNQDRKEFDEIFPADFVAEGIDQTRGWFYTLLVISTALFGKAPYKNLVANGLVLASDGQKMSKRKKNYPDPLEVINKYGADALRLYLINSPVVRAENLKFKEEGVRNIIKDVFLPWYNAFRFLMQNIDQYQESGIRFVITEGQESYSNNIMDKWIMSITQSLLIFVKKEMEEYRLYTVVPYLIKYIDNLTNWYVRMNRKRIKGEDGLKDCDNALTTLFLAIHTMVQTYAPFTPFLTEFMFMRLDQWVVTTSRDLPKNFENCTKYVENFTKTFKYQPSNRSDCESHPEPMDEEKSFKLKREEYVKKINEWNVKNDKELREYFENFNKSVHWKLIPHPQHHVINKDIEKAVSHMQSVIQLGRIVRDRKVIPTKYPLPEIVVIHRDDKVLRDIVSLKSYILEELNIKKLIITTDKEKYGVTLRAEPDHKTLGARLKGEFKQIIQAIKELSDEQLQKFVSTKEIIVQGHKLEEQDLRLMFSFTGPAAEQLSKQYEAHSEGSILILMDITADEAMHNEGIAREVINRVQKLRKKARLVPSDEAVAYYEIKDANSNLAKVIVSHKEFIENVTKTPQRDMTELPRNSDVIIEEMQKIKDMDMRLVLVRTSASHTSTQEGSTTSSKSQPSASYVNVILSNMQPRYGASSKDKIYLYNSQLGPLTYKRLKQEIDLVFGIYGCSYDMYLHAEKITRALDDTPVEKNMFDKQWLEVVRSINK
ncbi:PREDICTED: isoleucine--tRNA ligase, cytoplasmic [Trachymyrmex cornetzi]|uniref:Isoleucine--tRNA ligase, cytoplasmic n=1 Tax=Trachymyrmex cornetzi TaxID=471704 RepID=A0A151IU52_9HYME|nr:PREDICTED: isoleucine--tRNA ligase, cytoplasmic [Trachymyrmex cornetzi]KYN10937.1 putative isoleucyl-tRNA synthetase, cytoplasmic [Trachymyrmex cornetzi]